MIVQRKAKLLIAGGRERNDGWERMLRRYHMGKHQATVSG